MVLRYLRKKTRPILIGTLILIIPAFIFLYGWSRISERGAIPQVIAKVGKTPITYTDYQSELQEYISYLGEFYSEDAAKTIKRQILDILIQRRLLEEEAKKRKITVNDNEMIPQIREFFKNSAGQFDSKLFLFVNNRYPERIKLLEESVRAQIMLEKLKNEITSSVKVSDEEIRQYFLTAEAEAKIKYIAISPQDLRKDINISENELVEYYGKNKEKFKDGPWTKIEYIIMGEDSAKEQETNINNDEKEQILKDKAFQISLRLLDETDWTTFAQKEGLSYGITGYFSQDEQLEEFGGNLAINQAVFAIKPNEVSEPIKTEKGYVVFRRLSKAEPQYEEISDKIRLIVEEEKIKDLANRKAEEILSGLQSGKSEEEISKNYALTIKESNYFSRNGLIEDIGYAPDIARIAFSTAQNNWSRVNNLGGEIFIIKTVDIRQPLEEKFQGKKDSIATLLLNQKKQKIFTNWIEELKEKNKDRIVILWEELKEN